MTLDQVNALDRAAFVGALGGVFEHSPWVADAAWPRRPFTSLDTLHAVMVAAMRSAPQETQLALVRAHPELAGKAAIRGALTADSTEEQSSAGLKECSPQEFARLHALNRAYTAKFGFPFILAVKGLDREAIIARFAERLAHDRPTEWEEALQQIAAIARFRLGAMIEG